METNELRFELFFLERQPEVTTSTQKIYRRSRFLIMFVILLK